MSAFAADQIPQSLAAILPAGARLSWPEQGMTSDVAFASGADRTVVLKRCADPRYLEWLKREHRVLGAIEPLGLNAPRVLGYAETSTPGGPEVWLAMSMMPGRSMWDAMLEGGGRERERLLKQLGAFLQRVHATPVPAALIQSESWISRALAEARNNLGWSDGDEALLGKLGRGLPPPIPETLIHGDLSLQNVLIDDEGTVSLIDWSGGDSGDPRYDVTLALLTEPEFTLTETEIAAFHAAYGGAPLDPLTRRWFIGLYEFF